MAAQAAPSQARYLGLDVGGTTIKAGLVSAEGEVLLQNSVKSRTGGSREEVLADIDAALQPLSNESFDGLGVGFPSFGDYEQGVLDSELSGYQSMDGFALRQHLQDTDRVPTRLVPDANLFAYGILRFGEGRHLDSFIAVSLGTGTAIGLVRQHEVLTGPRGFPDATMRFYIEWGWPGAWSHSGYHFTDHYGEDPETTYHHAAAGDNAAGQAWEQVGEALGDTLIRLADETQIRAAFIGGGLAGAWEFIEPSLQACTMPKRIKVAKTGLSYPSLAGAAALFLPDEPRRPASNV